MSELGIFIFMSMGVAFLVAAALAGVYHKFSQKKYDIVAGVSLFIFGMLIFIISIIMVGGWAGMMVGSPGMFLSAGAVIGVLIHEQHKRNLLKHHDSHTNVKQ